MPTPAMESFEFAPRRKNRAAAAITVVMPEQEGQDELKCADRLGQYEGLLGGGK